MKFGEEKILKGENLFDQFVCHNPLAGKISQPMMNFGIQMQ